VVRIFSEVEVIVAENQDSSTSASPVQETRSFFEDWFVGAA
jgi:hypothetical protein